jgi:hypothetical protein
MQIGEMKRDVNPFFGTAKNFFGDYTKIALVKEGERLYRKYPEYKYLEEDPYIEWYKDPSLTFVDNNIIYKSVVYAYMVDQILKKYPEFNEEYKRIVQESVNKEKTGSVKELREKADKTYSSFNNRFLCWYQDYLREQADPGCLERERQEHERKQKALETARQVEKWKAKQQEQQDLASGKRVVCPYCHSTNTEKISTVSRAVSVSLVGAASVKLGKQWHCKQCGSNF